MKNIFIMGMGRSDHEMLATVRGAERYRFHGLLSHAALVNPEHYPVEALLDEARQELRGFEGRVDAIIGHWDFPTTSMLPVLRRECGLDGPSLESVLKCEHKYWSRVEQGEAAPEQTPAYQSIDPFAAHPERHLHLDYPFWLKPVVAFSSYLGFRIDGPEALRRALATTRKNIAKFSEPFDYLASLADLPPELTSLHGGYCIAEEMIGGKLCTLEGYVYRGEANVYDIVDSYRGQNEVSFEHYELPSALPDPVQQRMATSARRVMTHVGYDNGPFNIEMFWAPERDVIKILEINPRISKSHCPLFVRVAGASHHEVAIDLALGRRPAFPRREGQHRVAAKFMPRAYQDAVVTHAPEAEDQQTVLERFPGTAVHWHVRRGTRLSELPNQDSYSYELGEVYMGASSHDELVANYRQAMRRLKFRFSRPVETNY